VLSQHRNDGREIGMLIAEHLGLTWQENTGEPLATRLIAYAYELDEQKCHDLTGLLTVATRALPIAA
jgi:hypothetical protein